MITEKADKDGITIKYINTRLLKAPISIKSNSVKFVVGTEGHIHFRSRQHRSMSARSRIRLRFDLGKNQGREDR